MDACIHTYIHVASPHRHVYVSDNNLTTFNLSSATQFIVVLERELQGRIQKKN